RLGTSAARTGVAWERPWGSSSPTVHIARRIARRSVSNTETPKTSRGPARTLPTSMSGSLTPEDKRFLEQSIHTTGLADRCISSPPLSPSGPRPAECRAHRRMYVGPLPFRLPFGSVLDRVAAEATIDANEWSGPEALTRMITGNYIVGCNTIRVRSRDELSPSQLQEIHEAVRGLTGLTIVNQGPKFVTIENFVEPTRFPIDGLLRRLHYLTSRMEKLALGVIAGEVKGNIEEVARMELEVDRLYWLVVRQLLLAAQTRPICGRIGVTEPRHLPGH